jgi:Flp pilus assembly protein TadG
MGGRSILTSERGSVTVEFFLVLPMVILVLVAGLQVVGLAKARIELIGAVREGARIAATTPDPARAVDAVQAALPEDVRDRVRISVSRPSVVGKQARVSATLEHRMGSPLPTEFTVNISASAVMLVER